MSLLSNLMVRGYSENDFLTVNPAPNFGSEPVAIKCHEIARGFYVDAAKHNSSFRLDSGIYARLADLPTRPPFPATWMEWGLPMDLRLCREGGQWPELMDGVMLVRMQERYSASFFCQNPSGGAPVLIGVAEFDDGNGSFKDRFINGWLSPVGEQFAKAMFAHAGNEAWNTCYSEQWQDWDAPSRAANYLAGTGALYVIDVSLRMLHVKNVELAETAPKRRKKQRRPRPDEDIRWTTIRVRPQGKQYADASTSALPTMTALHVVRGHFATYSSEKPLFGKYTGTFWREAHTRGDAAAGEVAKDYTIEIEGKEAA